MKKILWILVGIIVIGGVFYLNQPNKTNAKVRFIAMLPLSGSIGYLGQEEKLGIETAYKETLNNNNVELIFEDTQGDPSITMTILRKHLAMGDMFYYTSTTAQTNAVLSVLEKEKEKPLVFAITMMPNQTKNYPLAYRIYPTSMQEMDTIAEYVKQHNLKKIGVLTAMMATYEGCISHLKGLLPNVEIYEETFRTEEKDFRILLEKMQKNNIEALVINGYAPHIRSILNHKDNQWNIPILSGFNTLQLTDIPYQQLKDVIFRQPKFILKITDSKIAQDNKNISVGYETFYAYDTMKMFMKAVENAKEITPKEIGKNLEKLDYTGLTGHIQFDEYRDARLQLGMFMFDSNKVIVPLESETK